MDTAIALSKEYLGEPSQDYRDLFQVIEANPNDAWLALPVLAQAMAQINQIDPKHKISCKLPDGSDFDLTDVENRYFWYLKEGNKILIGSIDYVAVSILVYREIADRVLSISVLYTTPEFEGLGLGKALLELCDPVRLVFKTRKANEPIRLKSLFKQCFKVCSSDHFDLWSLEREF